MRPHAHALRGVCPRRGAQHEVEGVFGVDGETGDLGAVHLQGPRDVSGLLAVAVQRQGDEVGGGEAHGVPLQDDARLGGVQAAEDGPRGGLGAEGGEDAVLEGLEGSGGALLGGAVAGNGDVDDATRGNVGWQKDGRELDLGRVRSSAQRRKRPRCARAWGKGAYQALVLSKEHRHAGVDLADCEGDEHRGGVGVGQRKFNWCIAIGFVSLTIWSVIGRVRAR